MVLKALPKVVMASALALVLTLGRIGWAQLATPNPLVVPPLPPSPPAQLPAPISTAIAPSPVPVPSIPAAYSTPGPRTFNCSCYGAGSPVNWIVQVSASGYASASQAASGNCLASEKGEPPPYGTAGGIGAANSYGSLPGAAEDAAAANSYGFPGSGGADAANRYGSPAGARSFSSVAQQSLCSTCFCD
jgi:hypothetical protein